MSTELQQQIAIQVTGFKQKPAFEQLSEQCVLKQVHCDCGIKDVKDWMACEKQRSPTQICNAVIVVEPIASAQPQRSDKQERKYCECDDPSVPHYPENHLITSVSEQQELTVSQMRERWESSLIELERVQAELTAEREKLQLMTDNRNFLIGQRDTARNETAGLEQQLLSALALAKVNHDNPDSNK